jgi:hypothetical protein
MVGVSWRDDPIPRANNVLAGKTTLLVAEVRTVRYKILVHGFF